MKSLEKILLVMMVFFFVTAVGYTVWTIIDTGGPEWVGVMTLFLMALFSAFIAFYLWFEGKPFRLKLLPEDRLDANIDEADPELGQFSPWSWWPILLAMTIGVTLVGMSVGWWPVFFVAPLVIWAIIGWGFEYYRGHLKH